MIRLVAVTSLLLVATACVYDDSCDRLADYVCDCHPEDPDACDDYRALAADPMSAILDQCVVELAEIQDQDEDDGLTCEVT